VATLFLTVLPGNDAPNVLRDEVHVDAGASVLVEPLSNDDDLREVGTGAVSGNNAASTTLLSYPFHGALSAAIAGAPGRYHHSPDPAFNGLDSF